MLYESIGWIGALLFCICGLPQAFQSYQEGHSRGLSSAFLLMWFFGELFSLVYVWVQPTTLWPVILNYLFNLLILAVIIKYKYWERKT